ncbi:ATP-binding protein [Streptomyces sp. NPDC056486]|uniref:ATP-binding protein n=1 Tax=Streptomyces sp. NPDC056486 TaxID=3345835 RepID=UPI0036782304
MKPGMGRGAPESRQLYSWGPGIENPVGHARAAVCAEFARLEVPGDVAENAVLAVSELVANAVEHACGPYAVCLRRTARELFCEVHDGCCRMPVVTSALSSVPFEPQEVDRGGGLDALCEALSERGRGLGIVNYLSRGNWGVRRTSGGKCIWVDVTSCSS